MAIPKISKTGFRAWLQQHHANDVVGESFDDCTCPLARYILSEYPHNYVCVGYSEIFIGSKVYPGFNWTARFITGITRIRNRITAKECLNVLTGC